MWSDTLPIHCIRSFISILLSTANVQVPVKQVLPLGIKYPCSAHRESQMNPAKHMRTYAQKRCSEEHLVLDTKLNLCIKPLNFEVSTLCRIFVHRVYNSERRFA